MLDRDRNDRFALVALSLILAAIFLVAIAALGGDYIAEHYAAKYGEQSYQGGNDDVRAVLSALQDFDPLDDTIPQWLMAFFAFIATVASIAALIYLRWTLEATRRIGQAQVRAYLSIESAGFRFAESGCSVTLYLKNSGQSPATKITVQAHLMTPDPVDSGPLRAFGPAHATQGAVMSGSKDSVYVQFTGEVVPDYILFNLFNAGFMVAFSCVIEWWDVFDRRQTLEARLVEEQWEWEAVSGSDKRVRVGQMFISNARHDAG